VAGPGGETPHPVENAQLIGDSRRRWLNGPPQRIAESGSACAGDLDPNCHCAENLKGAHADRHSKMRFRIPFEQVIVPRMLLLAAASSAKSSCIRVRGSHGMLGLDRSPGKRLEESDVPCDVHAQIEGDGLVQTIVCRG
jgi:hypothetical protein